MPACQVPNNASCKPPQRSASEVDHHVQRVESSAEFLTQSKNPSLVGNLTTLDAEVQQVHGEHECDHGSLARAHGYHAAERNSAK